MISVSMATAVGTSCHRVWHALTSQSELIRWDDHLIEFVSPSAARGGPRTCPKHRYRLGSVEVGLRYQPLEVVHERTLRAEVELGLFRFEATHKLFPDAEDSGRTQLSLRLVFSNTLPVVGGEIDRFDMRRLATDLALSNLNALRDWCESHPKIEATHPERKKADQSAPRRLRYAALPSPSDLDHQIADA
jgi:hypothetical protein